MKIDEVRYRIIRYASLVGLGLRFILRFNPGRHIDPVHKYRFCTTQRSSLPILPYFSINLAEPDISLKKMGLSNSILKNINSDDKLLTDWHRDSECKPAWPRIFFARIRQHNKIKSSEIQVIWNKSRLQNLFDLALACQHLSNPDQQKEITNCIESTIHSWINSNPWLIGIHYLSTMECALRLISLCHTFDLIRKFQICESTWQALLQLVREHAYFIHRRLSLFSYAGNHTIGECAGLIYAGILFPEFPESKHWLRTGLKLLQQEIDSQILVDGGNREQSFRYLLLIVDLCGLVVMLLKHHDHPVPKAIEQGWRRGCHFLQSFADCPEHLPTIGDSDDGFALSRYLKLSWQHVPCTSPSTTPTKRFESSGYSNIAGTSAHGSMLFHHGRLGITAGGFGHGHADALSVDWKWNDRCILVDPGTHCYDKDPQFRGYFRSTAAHNTIMIDSLDQARQEQHTEFAWNDSYHAHLIASTTTSTDRIITLAQHDGYARIGIIHSRAIIYDPDFGWAIWDRVDGQGLHQLDLHWHIDAPIDMDEQRITVNVLDSAWNIEVKDEIPKLYYGNKTEPLGWISRQFGKLEPINTLRVTRKVKLPHEFLTYIYPKQESPSLLPNYNDELCMLRGTLVPLNTHQSIT